MNLSGLVLHIFDLFWELDAGRPVGFGHSPMSFVEIDAWCRVHGTALTPFELRAIKAMDKSLITSLRKDQDHG